MSAAPLLVTILSKDSDFYMFNPLTLCVIIKNKPYINTSHCNATFFAIFPQSLHGTMVSSKVPHPIHTKTSLLIGINVSEKKLSLLELDS